MVETGHKHLQSEKTNLGFTTTQALERLSEDIEELVRSYEQRFHNEW